jgi:hypothetical protein
MVWDQVLAWAVVILPTLFAAGIEIVSKEIKQHPYWRVGVIAFGIGLSALTWLQISRASRSAILDRQAVIEETSTSVAGTVMKRYIEYTEAHPQQQMTPAQFAELLIKKGITMSKPVVDFKKEKDSTGIPTIGPLIERATSASRSLRDLPGEWYGGDNNLYLQWYDERGFSLREDKSPQERDAHKKAADDLALQRVKVNAKYKDQMMHLLIEADAVRKALVESLPTSARTAEDFTQEQVARQLIQTVNNAKEQWQCPTSAINAFTDYFDTLVKRASKG